MQPSTLRVPCVYLALSTPPPRRLTLTHNACGCDPTTTSKHETHNKQEKVGETTNVRDPYNQWGPFPARPGGRGPASMPDPRHLHAGVGHWLRVSKGSGCGMRWEVMDGCVEPLQTVSALCPSQPCMYHGASSRQGGHSPLLQGGVPMWWSSCRGSVRGTATLR